MVKPTADQLPSAEATLKALRQFAGKLFLDNPCTARRSRCVYLAPTARSVLGLNNDQAVMELLEAEYAVEVEAMPSFVSPETYDALQGNCVWLPSDSYICHGSTSQGSGRSVFKGQHQLKGVGRTLHVGHHSFFRDITGALSLREAAVEAAMAERLQHVLKTPPIPVDFLLVPEQGDKQLRLRLTDDELPDIRCIMGRRGSPFRIGHLDFLTAELRSVNPRKVGSYLVHLLLSQMGGVPKAGIETALLDTFDQLMKRAVRLSAESLVYSLRMSYWADNFDVFSRVVDVAETSFRFPEMLVDETPLAAPAGNETPSSYLTRVNLSIKTLRSHTLYPIRNLLSTLHLIAREVRMPASKLDERYSWDWLRVTHRKDVMCCVANVLGTPESHVQKSAELRSALEPVADAFPLLADDARDTSFLWNEFIEQFERGQPAGSRQNAILERGRAFRSLIAQEDVAQTMAAVANDVEQRIIVPYLKSGLEGVPRAGEDPKSQTSAKPAKAATSTLRKLRAANAERTIDGYVDDVPYVSAFHQRFSPPWTDAILLSQRICPPRTKRGKFTLVDLGCGDGYGLVALAAAHPEGRIIGIDASRAHIEHGNALIARLGLRNVELRHETFDESTLGVKADYVTAQGVLSWISPSSRASFRRLVARLLKPGGVFSVGYNANPRWARYAPFQRLVRAVAESLPGSSPSRFAEAFEVVRNSGAVDPIVLAQLAEGRKSASPNYYAHEFLNAHWEPFWSGDVIASFEDCGLQLVGAATSERYRDDLAFTPEEIAHLAKLESVRARELAADLFLNESFRIDMFMKTPVRRISAHEVTKRRLAAYWGATKAVRGVEYFCDTHAGRLRFDNKAARAILAQLESGPAALGAVKGLTANEALNTIDTLFVARLIRPADVPAEVPHAAAFNAFVRSQKPETWPVHVVVGAHGAMTPVSHVDEIGAAELRRLGVLEGQPGRQR